MSAEKMFEFAARTKMRFSFKGLITVEDLWDLSPKELDSIFRNLNSQLKQVKEESLLDIRTSQDEELDIKIKIVKYIFETMLDEGTKKIKAAEQKSKKQKIMEIIATKQDADLQGKSVDELKDMLNELED